MHNTAAFEEGEVAGHFSPRALSAACHGGLFMACLAASTNNHPYTLFCQTTDCMWGWAEVLYVCTPTHAGREEVWFGVIQQMVRVHSLLTGWYIPLCVHIFLLCCAKCSVCWPWNVSITFLYMGCTIFSDTVIF